MFTNRTLALYTAYVFRGLIRDGISKIARQELMKPSCLGADIERMSLEDGEMKQGV